ncbi:MAG: ABC transporter ATP-binding protein, partial [Caldilineaceae bacterium]|nr:ABC transporter ATP-binding protein [Caldilineaceae bacterium]
RSIRDVVGYLPEDDCYIAGLQGVECVQLAGRLSGLERMEALRRSHEVMDFCDIGQERYRQVETYSTGMRQKLKFAQTLVHDPPLIILDEPTTGLDPSQRDALLNRIRTIADNHKKTILLSTHILPDVRQVCDSVAILAGGKVRVSASLEELSKPSRPGLSVWFASGKDEFLAMANAEGLVVRVEPRGEIQVEGLSDSETERIWQIAGRSGAIVRRLEPARASLEQIFIDVVRQTTNVAPNSEIDVASADEEAINAYH